MNRGRGRDKTCFHNRQKKPNLATIIAENFMKRVPFFAAALPAAVLRPATLLAAALFAVLFLLALPAALHAQTAKDFLDTDSLVVQGVQPEMLSRQFGFTEGDYPITEYIASRTLALPFFAKMNHAQIGQVCHILESTLEKVLLGRKGRF